MPHFIASINHVQHFYAAANQCFHYSLLPHQASVESAYLEAISQAG